MEKEEKDPLFN